MVGHVERRTERRDLGRGDRVLPGLWRLRLPLPWPGVPHCNAWAIKAGDGIVLVDTGMHEPDSLAQLRRAMDQVGLRLNQIRLLVCTHAHADHWGQAATIKDATGCEFLMHPDHAHATQTAGDREAALARRLEVGRQSGVSETALARYVERAQSLPPGIARVIEPDRPLVPGVRIDTDLGAFTVIETPGHAPSHVCLFNAGHRLLISGDHLLGRISLYYDYGWTPDPVGEFLASLDRIEPLGARLCVSGHGRPFTDVAGHITSNRELVAKRLAAARAALAGGPRPAVEIAPLVHGAPLNVVNGSWLLSETLCYLRHLETTGEVASESRGELTVWRSQQP